MLPLCRLRLFLLNLLTFTGIAFAYLETKAQESARDTSKPRDTEILEQVKGSLAETKISEQESASLLRMLQPIPPDRTRLFIPSPSGKGRPEAVAQAKLADKLKEILAPLAAKAFEEAEAALERGENSEAYQALFRTLALDPDHPVASQILKSSVQALSARKVQARASQAVPLLGWQEGSYALISTPHFEILSRAPSKSSGQLADLCEQVYCAWQQLFFEYWAEPEQLKLAMQGKTRNANGLEAKEHRFRIVLFRNAKEYESQLSQIEKNIGVSRGYYSPNAKLAFFYWDDSESIETMRHELIHQFFNEAGRNPAQYNESKSGVWAVEGIACYFESLERIADWSLDAFEIGGWDASRIQAARYRRFHEESWIPWEEFHVETAEHLKRSPEIARWYSQASGLAHLWMDTGASNRAQFRKYLDSIYAGVEDEKTLELVSSDEKLRAAYEKFLTVSADQVAHREWSPERSKAVLSRLPLTSKDLMVWPGNLRKLDWLDLAFTKVDDSLFVDQEDAWDVKRLDLEGTAITDEALKAIAKMPRLEKLYLSECSITDEGLIVLKGNTRLKELWINGTQVTDKSFETLKSLRSMEDLELPADFPAAVIKKLHGALPKWKAK